MEPMKEDNRKVFLTKNEHNALKDFRDPKDPKNADDYRR